MHARSPLAPQVGTGLGLDAVCGLTSAVNRIQSIVVAPMIGSWAGVPGHRAPSGVLLYGTPSGGKRYLVSAIAQTLEVPLRELAVSELIDHHGFAAMMGHVRRTTGTQPSVIHLAGLDDALAGEAPVSTQRRVAALLEASRADDPEQSQIFIATSSRPWEIDQALFSPGRFDHLVHVSPPDWTARVGRLTRAAERYRMSILPIIEPLARSTAGWTGADINRLIDELAVLSAVTNGTPVAPMIAAALTTCGPTAHQWFDRSGVLLALQGDRGMFGDLAEWFQHHVSS